MDWKKKKGDWRAVDGKNHYVITIGPDPNYAPFEIKELRPVVGTNWVTYAALSFAEAKEFCEKLNESAKRIEQAKMQRHQKRLVTLEAVSAVLGVHAKRNMAAYRRFLKMDSVAKEALRETYPETVAYFERLQAADFDPDHIFYKMEKEEKDGQQGQNDVNAEHHPA